MFYESSKIQKIESKKPTIEIEYNYIWKIKIMKKLLLILLCVPLIGFGQCMSGDCENGYGTYIFPNQDKYVGKYKDGNFHGKGTYTFSNGDKYVGEHKDGERNGQGIYTYTSYVRSCIRNSGSKYVGEFKDGLYHGQGTKIWKKGTVFEGDRYVGQWKENKKHGKGTYITSDEKQYKGMWENDKFIGEE